ncbi:MAG: DNA alkylation repair protein [Bacteroidetes bacterium]|nr:DNA alkylation repair protein [Cytophagia bacterium]MBT6834821.1 DNA alkylation repair protein [Bacteroidota bacterium]
MNYLKPLIDSFSSNANPEYAVWMEKYMRNQFRFFGLRGPKLKELGKQFINEYGLPPIADYPAIVKQLWDLNEREFQFFALSLMGKMKKQTDASYIDVYEFLITEKSWWDTVDHLAAALVGYHFIRFPEQIIPNTEKWMSSGNMWLQRSALLFQLKYKKETDFDLLTSYIKRLMHSKEFFIRKAIGWTLREYSKTDPASVIDFVQSYEEQLSGLSKREALKAIERKSKK